MADQLPVHPLTGLTALGVLPSGRIVWPVLCGAPEDGDDDTGTGDSGGEDGGTDDDGAEDSDTGGEDGDDLGDKGRAALAKERRARRDADKARKAAERKLAELEAKQSGSKDGDGAPDAEQIRRDAEKDATAKANRKILAAEIRAAGAGKMADPADALKYLDLTQFEVGDDGSVDAEDIAEAISDLIKRKPYLAAKATGFQGGGDGGARQGGRGPRQVTDAELKTMSAQQIVKARQEGRLTQLMGG
jgi:hypothetical protein